MTHTLRTGALMVMLFAFGSCTSVPRSAIREDGTWCFQSAKKRLCTTKQVPTESAEADAKSFNVATGKHAVWIIRNDWWDAAGRVEIDVGGVVVETIPRTAVKVELPAGSALVTVISNAGETRSKVSLPSSSLSFLLLEREWGLLTDRYTLKAVDDTTAKAMAKRSKLISINDASGNFLR